MTIQSFRQLLCALPLCALLHLPAQDGLASPLNNRSLFVWDTGIVGNETAVNDMLDFAEAKGVDILYLDAAGLIPGFSGDPADYDSLLTAAHSRGLQVYALLGNPWWGVACGENLPGQIECIDDGAAAWQAIVSYQSNGNYEDFDGFIDDTEPYIADTADWWNRTAIRAQMLLDYHNAARAALGPDAYYVAVIPFWYDNDPNLNCLNLDGKTGLCRPLAWYLSDQWSYADETAIMDYRDFDVHPLDPNHGITPFSQYEVNTFKTTIIVETFDLDAEGVCEVYEGANCILDFSAEGEAVMEAELAEVYAAHVGTGNLHGFGIHYYDSYVAMASPASEITLTSIAAEDGWVRESTETSNAGGTVNATAAGKRALRPGDATGDRQYKSILSFDTSSIPAGATIQSATLRVKRGGVRGSNPFNNGFGQCLVDVQTGGFSGDPALESSDFEAAATAPAAAALTPPPGHFTWSEGALDAAGIAAINTSGVTQMRIYFELDDNDDGGDDHMGYYSANHSDPANHPQLVVTYVE